MRGLMDAECPRRAACAAADRGRASAVEHATVVIPLGLVASHPAR
jgi:hypothetical protein